MKVKLVMVVFLFKDTRKTGRFFGTENGFSIFVKKENKKSASFILLSLANFLLFLLPYEVNRKKEKKEVTQPQVPLRLPCDDLTLLAELRFEPIENGTSSKPSEEG